jgi:hypothetical protein
VAFKGDDTYTDPDRRTWALNKGVFTLIRVGVIPFKRHTSLDPRVDIQLASISKSQKGGVFVY